jgi:GlpG protein
MRLLASLPDEDQASRLGDYLLTLGIGNSVEQGASGWSVWVSDDDKVDAAKLELAQFQANPNDPRYSSAARTAEKVRTQQAKQERRRAENFVDVRTQWAGAQGKPVIVTLSLIIISCIVFGLTYARSKEEIYSFLWIAAHPMPRTVIDTGMMLMSYFSPSELTEIRHGQVWRLITPIFIHYSPLHLIFNMFWTRDLGSMIERRKSSLWLLVMVLVIGVVSNFLQFVASGPWAGGMSGVVYGLFGYVWMKGRYSPHEGMALHPHTVIYMVAWFVLCFTGLVGAIANTAHAVGLIMGIVFGSAGYLRRKYLRA